MKEKAQKKVEAPKFKSGEEVWIHYEHDDGSYKVSAAKTHAMGTAGSIVVMVEEELPFKIRVPRTMVFTSKADATKDLQRIKKRLEIWNEYELYAKALGCVRILSTVDTPIENLNPEELAGVCDAIGLDSKGMLKKSRTEEAVKKIADARKEFWKSKDAKAKLEEYQARVTAYERKYPRAIRDNLAEYLDGGAWDPLKFDEQAAIAREKRKKKPAMIQPNEKTLLIIEEGQRKARKSA